MIAFYLLLTSKVSHSKRLGVVYILEHNDILIPAPNVLDENIDNTVPAGARKGKFVSRSHLHT